MKTFLLSLTVIALSLPSRAQDVNAAVTQPSAEKTAVEASQEAAKKVAEKQKADALLLKKPISYSGFATDLSKAGDKKKFLSLRQPVDPKVDYKHLLYTENGRQPKGFILFSLDF